MNKITIIGQGTVGSILKQQFDTVSSYNSTNIREIMHENHDLLICAAPSGNRLYVNAFPEDDLQNIKELVSIIEKTSFTVLVLISTVDVLVKNSHYAQNRKYLEDALRKLPGCKILRLSTLIDTNIKKNVLYDLKNKCYLEKINGCDVSQWYVMSNLKDDILSIVNSENREINLVSEPIANWEIFDKFYPEGRTVIKFDDNIKFEYGITPYNSSKDDIFKEMEEYLGYCSTK